MSKYDNKLVIFDLDGTLRITKSGSVAPNTADDVVIPEEVQSHIAIIRKLTRNSIFAGASNQGGVSFGMLTAMDAWHAAIETNSKLGQIMSHIELAFYHPKGEYAYKYESQRQLRKPDIGMVFEIMNRYPSYKDVLFVGDGKSDKECAERSNIDFMWAHEFLELPYKETKFGMEVQFGERQ